MGLTDRAQVRDFLQQHGDPTATPPLEITSTAWVRGFSPLHRWISPSVNPPHFVLGTLSPQGYIQLVKIKDSSLGGAGGSSWNLR